MNLARLLIERADQSPDAEAIIESAHGRDRITTFAELAHRGQQFAALFESDGLRRGDTALIFVPMSATLYEILLGLWAVGASASFLDPASGGTAFERASEILPSAAFIGTPRAQMLRLSSSALRRIPLAYTVGPALPRTRSLHGARSLEPNGSIVDVGPDSPALVTFTSGSTGTPKAAVRTHSFLQSQYEVLQNHLCLKPGQRDLATLPVFALADLASGATMIVPEADLRSPGSIDAPRVLNQIDRLGVSRITASPAFLERLADECERRGQTIGSLMTLHTGGGPVFPRLLDRLRVIAPNARISAVFGSTEAEPISELRADDLNAETRRTVASGGGLPAGFPIAEIELRIVQATWGEPLGSLTQPLFDAMTSEPGEAGEIVVSGPHVLKGYLAGAGDAENKFDVDGTRWHRTGDAGYLDATGRLWLLGRAGERILDTRGVVYPFSVEAVALQDPAVRRAALVSVENLRVLAVEWVTPGHAMADAMDTLAIEGVDLIVPVDHIPVDTRHNSKVDYPALRRFLSQEVGGRRHDPRTG